MLNIQTDPDHNVISARPEGQIPADEFDKLAQSIEDYVQTHGKAPGLVIQMGGLPHWDGFAALSAHFDLIRKNVGRVPRVAMITDVMGLSALPGIADLFTRARLRHFDVSDRDKAIAWAGSPEPEDQGYQILDGFPDNVIAIRAVGEVTARDYEDRLIPLVRDKAGQGKIRLLMQVGEDFEGYSAGAMWDDARLGLTHWRSFERVAIVSDIGWITRAIKLFAPLIPGEVAVFPNSGFDAAKAWISGEYLSA